MSILVLYYSYYKLMKIIAFLSKTKRPEVLDSDDENMESQQKKRRRIKKPQPDSSDDEGRGGVEKTKRKTTD